MKIISAWPPAMTLFVKLITLLVVFQCGSLQETTEKRVVEGLSINVDVICDIDRQLRPYYWKIEGKIFDLESIPEFFDMQSDHVLTIHIVDRRLNGWSFQCFTIDLSTSEGIHPGLITILTVYYNVNVEGQTDLSNLTQPYLYQTPVLDYQSSVDANDNITWFYSLRSDAYRVYLYTHDQINSAQSEGDMTPHVVLIANEGSIQYNCTGYYFRISANTNGEEILSKHFYDIMGRDNVIIIANESTASIMIPEDLRNSSLQLIWLKDDSTQCVCPLIERLIEICACNKDTSTNFVTISGHNVTISNLTQYLSMHLVSATTGCQHACSLRSVVITYQIMIIDGQATQPDQNIDTTDVELDNYCTYYEDEVDVQVLPSSMTASLTLNCGQHYEWNLLLVFDTVKSTLVIEAMSLCNSTKNISNLTPSTNYSVMISHNHNGIILNCIHTSFTTLHPLAGTHGEIFQYYIVITPLSILLLSAFVAVFFSHMVLLQKRYKKEYKT